MTNHIYHLISPSFGLEFLKQSEYQAASLKSEGFIHCCNEDQINYVRTTYFAQENKIIVLKIDSSKLTSTLKVEPVQVGDKEMHFPHIYGSINTDAIVEHYEIENNSKDKE